MLNFCPNYLAKLSDYILIRLFGSLLKFKACSKYSLFTSQNLGLLLLDITYLRVLNDL
jgi:hypothetical protein